MKLKRPDSFKGSEQDFPALLIPADNLKPYLQDLREGKLKTLAARANIENLYDKTACIGLAPSGRYLLQAKGETVKIAYKSKTVTYRRA